MARKSARSFEDKSTQTGLMVLLVATFALKGLTDALLYARGDEDNALMDLKYGTALLVIVLGFVYMPKVKNKIFLKEFWKLGTVFAAFAFISLVLMPNHGSISSSVLSELIKLGFPMVIAYSVLNVLDEDQIYTCMCWVLLVAFGCYWLEVFADGLISPLEIITNSSFSDSSSPLESSLFASTAMACLFYFCYYRQRSLCTVLSTIFAICVFKRLLIVFAVVAFFLPLVIDRDYQLPDWAPLLIKVVFFTGTLLYLYLLLPESADLFTSIFGETQAEFTSGRSTFLSWLLDSGYVSYGYGSATEYLNRDIEMDFIKITLELSPFALALFINNYWDIAGRNVYCSLYMAYLFLNLVTSHNLTANFDWALVFITIGSIQYHRSKSLSGLDAQISKRFVRGKRHHVDG